LKWTSYLLASLVITHSFLAYFVGTDRLAEMITRPPSENWVSFLFIVASTGIILFDFAWFREQFCIIACPYGRFQSVLMDDHSTIVAYDPARGEPRATPQAKALSKAHGTQLGDCVNCYRCVQVCPTGIDIRRGVQMECIACTACIDACDEVMTKLKKPTGMIRYDSLRGLQKNPRAPRRLLRARPAVYLVIVAAAVVSLITLLAMMEPVEITVLRAKEAPYTLQESPGQETHVLNHFKIELSNQSNSLRHLSFELRNAAPSIELITAHRPLPVDEGQMKRADLFMRFPKSILENGQLKLQLLVRNLDTRTGEESVSEKEVTLVGPF
jgi:cytochrome c oxidase accessory protein FixG